MTARPLDGLKVLLLTESFSSRTSGGLCTRRLSLLIAQGGADVRAFHLSADCSGIDSVSPPVQVEVAPGCRIGGWLHIVPSAQLMALRRLLRIYRPHIIHWLSFGYGKSRYLIAEARQSSARLVAQPWTHDYFCAEVYDFLDGGPCSRCAGGAFHHALRHGCGPGHSRLLQMLSRYLIRLDMLKCDVVLSTNQSMDRRLLQYGFAPSCLVRMPLPFDLARVASLRPMLGRELVYLGQFEKYKGVHLLPSIARHVPHVNIAVFPTNPDRECRRRMVDWGYDAANPNLNVTCGMNWSTGLDQRVASSRCVLLPSLWPTTTENVLLEAMALCKPVIAFDVGANADLLTNGRNGILVPLGDVKAFAQAINAIARDDVFAMSLGRAARETVESLSADFTYLGALERAYCP